MQNINQIRVSKGIIGFTTACIKVKVSSRAIIKYICHKVPISSADVN